MKFQRIAASAAGQWSGLATASPSVGGPDWQLIGWQPMPQRSRRPYAFVLSLFLCLAGPLFAQAPAGQYQVTKITKNLITSPQFTYTGAQQYVSNQRDRWLEVEVEFASSAEFTDELTLRYFILVNGKLLTGEVTHTNVAGGRESRSVMYVPPQALNRVMGNRPLASNSIQNIAVQIAVQ